MLSSRSVPAFPDNYESGAYIRTASSKTPGRTLKGRTALQENASQHASMTVNHKERRVALQTPKLHIHPTKSTSKEPSAGNEHTVHIRPLVDKTPLPNRQHNILFSSRKPFDRKGTESTLPPLADENEAACQGAPSSLRRKQRIPQSGTRNYATPITKGDYWDVSDTSLDAGTSNSPRTKEEAIEPDFSDPEYLPPKPAEPLFELPFATPDYGRVGEMLRAVAYSYPCEGDFSTLDDINTEDLLSACQWNSSYNLGHLTETESDDDSIFSPSSDTKISLPKRGTSQRPVTRSMTEKKRRQQALVLSQNSIEASMPQDDVQRPDDEFSVAIMKDLEDLGASNQDDFQFEL